MTHGVKSDKMDAVVADVCSPFLLISCSFPSLFCYAGGVLKVCATLTKNATIPQINATSSKEYT